MPGAEDIPGSARIIQSSQIRNRAETVNTLSRSIKSRPIYPNVVMVSSVRQKRTMLLLNRAQRAVLVDKVPDVANLAIGALSFGQFLGDRPFSFTRALFGVGMWVILMAWTIVLASERNDT
jgi:hypothetical protein